MLDKSRDEEEKREEFNLFEYANYCGLILGIFGATIIEIFILYMRDKTLESSIGNGLVLIAFISIVLYVIIRSRVRQMIGVSDSLEIIYTYKSETDSLYDIVKHFLNLYKDSEVNRDSSLDYELKDKRNKKFWDSKKEEANIIISHKSKERLNIRIQFKDNAINVIRPTTNSAKKYYEKLDNFIIKKLPNKKFLVDVEFLKQYATKEE